MPTGRDRGRRKRSVCETATMCPEKGEGINLATLRKRLFSIE